MKDIKDKALCARSTFIDIGYAPIGQNNVMNAFGRIADLKLDTKGTVVVVSITGNSLVRDKYGGVSFREQHHHNGTKVCSVSDFKDLVNLQLDLVGRLANIGFKVISLSPFPRYFAPCCVDNDHFDAGFSPVTLNELIRDGGTFMSRRTNTMWTDSPRSVVGVHPERFFSDRVYVAESVIWRDHVHMKNNLRVQMVQGLVDLSNKLVTGLPVTDWYDPTLIPDGIGFNEWLPAYREHNLDKLPAIVCAGAKPACVSFRPEVSRRVDYPNHQRRAHSGRGRGNRGNRHKKAKRN